MRASVLAALLLMSIAGSASAESLLLIMDRGPAKVALMKSVAQACEASGLKVEVAKASLEDSAFLLGCETADDACLREVAQASGAESILILPSTPGALVAMRGDKRHTTNAPGDGDDAESWRAALAEVLKEGGAPIAPAESDPNATTTADAQTSADVEAEEPQPKTTDASTAPATHSALVVNASTGNDGFRFDRVRRRSWIVAGTGVAAVGLGLLSFSLASSIQDDVNGHSTETVADLQALQELEADGSRFTTAGNVLVIGGTLTLAAGALLMVIDNKRAEPGEGLSLQPTLSAHGVGLVLSTGGVY